MKIRWFHFIGVLLLCLALPACQPSAATPTPVPPQPTAMPAPTQAAMATAMPAQPTQAPATAMPPTPIPATATPAIVHTMIPVNPIYIASQTTYDCNFGGRATPTAPVTVKANCDNATNGLFERPFTSDTKAYLSYLDIERAEFGEDTTWLYANIGVANAVAPTGSGDEYYFFDLNLNFDNENSNNIVISVKNLPLDNTNWTTDGVQAWSNAKGTVTKNL